MAKLDQSFSNTPNDFLDQPVGRRGDGKVGLRIRRSILVAGILSLLLHALLALKVVRQQVLDQAIPFEQSDTIVVTLAPPPTTPEPKKEAPQKPKKKQIKKKKQVAKKKPKVIAKKPKPAKPKVTKPNDFKVPDEMVKPQPKETPQPTEKPVATPTDMAEYIKQQQAKRQSQEAAAARENAIAIAKLKGPSKEEQRNQRIKDNLKVGTNGIFEITRMDALGAGFKFKGWTNDYSAAKLQYFDVPAQPGKDTRRLVIKRIIKLIRSHYDGDFTWDSHRLGESVTLSAKLEDSEGLEHFLMQEFFGTHYSQ